MSLFLYVFSPFSLLPKDSEGGRTALALSGDQALCPRQTPALSPHPARILSVLLFLLLSFCAKEKLKIISLMELLWR